MAPTVDIVTEPSTLAPLDGYKMLRRGLVAVSFFGVLSCALSTALFFRLAWRLASRSSGLSRNGTRTRTNQFLILLFSLLFADIQQSMAFLLNIHWLSANSITVGTSTCWAQGWFVSTGDLSSGLFTLAIACHAFMDIVLDCRLGPKAFGSTIAGLWTFNYVLAIIGMGMHPHDFYERAGAWCWISGKYTNERLYLHYFWVIIAEFGTVIIYALIWIILQRRVKQSFYSNSDTLLRARSAAKVIIAYPIVYVVCTLPLVKARLTSMAHEKVSFLELTIAGAMITSNGWLDVLLYGLTRRAFLFGPDITDAQAGILETFRFRPDQDYGTTTIIEADKPTRMPSRRKLSHQALHSKSGSTEELWSTTPGVKTETTVVIRNDAMEMDAIRREEAGEIDLTKDTMSFDSRSQKSRKSRTLKWRSDGV